LLIIYDESDRPSGQFIQLAAGLAAGDRVRTLILDLGVSSSYGMQISIVIACLNPAAVIGPYRQSIVEQDHPLVEIVLLHLGSTGGGL
jgi:hypothetical protein